MTHMRKTQIEGKLMVFQSNLPSIRVGRLRLRGDEVRAYGTNKEPILRIPEDTFNKQMAVEFTKNQISVNIFASNNKYCDIAFLGTRAKYTGGFVRFVRYTSSSGERRIRIHTAVAPMVPDLGEMCCQAGAVVSVLSRVVFRQKRTCLLFS